MTEHLPECLVPDFDKGLWVCICNQLRACEARVLDAAREALLALPEYALRDTCANALKKKQ